MIEPEVAFYNLEDNIFLAEKFLKYCIKFCLENYKNELAFLNDKLLKEEANLKKEQRSEMSLLERLHCVSENDFVVLTYSEAIEILKNSKPNKKKKFNYIISGFGDDLQSEHERYLVEKVYKKPVAIYLLKM